MCRFMLNLKRASSPNTGLNSLSTVTVPWSTIRFGHSDGQPPSPILEEMGGPFGFEDSRMGRQSMAEGVRVV